MKILIGKAGIDSKWRKEFDAKTVGNSIELVEDESQKDDCDYILYVVSPETQAVTPVVKAVNDSNFNTEKTIFCFLEEDESDKTFTSHQVKSLIATGKMIARNGGKWFTSIDETIRFLSGQA